FRSSPTEIWVSASVTIAAAPNSLRDCSIWRVSDGPRNALLFNHDGQERATIRQQNVSSA
ncbi:MAG TPA: hypothetical protein VGO18_20930, partial [Steroidobacteraceae bacterium]|nr:hypothetical protein [Steroidobacteraceae bacterium]